MRLIRYNIDIMKKHSKYIDIHDYEIIKVISDQFRTLAWAIAGIYAYFGFSENKYIAGLVVFILWSIFMILSLIMLTMAVKRKNTKEMEA